MPSLFLSTPCYGGVCLQAYAESILKLQRMCAQNGVQLMLDTTENESLVHRARNISVARFMIRSQADYFMFVDADVKFEPESVMRLLGSGHDVSCAVYPKKVVMWDQAEHAVKTNDTRSLNKLAASLVMNFKQANAQIVNGFVEVLDGPTGFLMIKRDVFKRMFERYPELNCKNDHQNRDFEDYCAVFDCMIDPENRRYLSEDYAFCRRWQQMGGQIFADVTTTLGHVGNIRFTGKLEDRITA
jgi:cellulose synthase/poly-beta-1,6-N-acetylglucosamine synthase-like glycosyltransferase